MDFRSSPDTIAPGFFFSFCRALASLHQHHFVHADLKPANIMWSSYDGRFKVLDFGLTFHTDEEDLHQIQSPGKFGKKLQQARQLKDAPYKISFNLKSSFRLQGPRSHRME